MFESGFKIFFKKTIELLLHLPASKMEDTNYLPHPDWVLNFGKIKSTWFVAQIETFLIQELTRYMIPTSIVTSLKYYTIGRLTSRV